MLQVITKRPGILFLAFGQMLVWASLFYIFPALLLRWEGGFGWSKGGITGALTVALLSSAVCSPLVGRWIDRGAGPVLLASGAACGAVCLSLMTLVSALWQFYLLWAVIGCALSACLYEPCFMLITRAYGKDAKRSIIVVTLIAGFASSISFPVAHLVAELAGFRAVMWSFGAIAFFLSAPLLYYGGKLVESDVTIVSAAADINADKSVYLKNPVFLKLAFSFAVLAVVHGSALHHLLPLLHDRGISIGNAVLVASLVGPMQVAGRVIITVFQQRLGHPLIARSCFVLMGGSMVLLFLSFYDLWVAVFFAIVFGASYGVVSIIRPVIARDLLGEQNFGAKSGLLAFFYLIGSATAPYFASLLWSAGGYNLLIFILMLFCGAGLLLIHSATRVPAEY